MNAALLLALIVFAGGAKALMDACAHGKMKGAFWDESKAWKGKWKNGEKAQGEAFPGSSTFFVLVTSGWHLTQAFFLAAMFLAIVFYKPTLNWWADFLILRVAFGATFQLIYGRF